MLTENELMIGDYLYWGKDKIVKVQMLRKYGDNFGIDVVYNDSVNLYFCTDNDDIYSYNIDELKPIPLTPEILEKNDFKYGDGYGYSFVNRKELSGDGFEEEKVYINTALNTLIIYTAASSIHLPVKYIHQLQHALRLCGIKKEIEL